MHDTHPTTQAGQHVPFKKGGWGAALFIVFLALACAAFATYVHKTTYIEPQDVHFRAKGAPASQP